MPHTKVLIVDDEEDFASTLSERLQIRGYDSIAVFCAEDAVLIAKSSPPDVVLLDLKMPGISGIEVLKAIKQINPSIEVIMLTGHGAEQGGAEGLANGASAYIMKPIDIEKLVDTIDKAKQKASSS
jgi:DNA-binding response OmpR family regulator